MKTGKFFILLCSDFEGILVFAMGNSISLVISVFCWNILLYYKQKHVVCSFFFYKFVWSIKLIWSGMFHLFLVSPEIFYGIWCMVICYDFRSVILQDLNKRVWFAKLALLFILQGHSSEEVVLQSICGACPSLAAGIVQLYASTIQILCYPPISGNKLTTPTGSRDRRHPE